MMVVQGTWSQYSNYECIDIPIPLTYGLWLHLTGRDCTEGCYETHSVISGFVRADKYVCAVQ